MGSEATTEYLKKYPYREKCFSSELGSELIPKIAEYEAQENHVYWHRFGYGIAGPICYAFVKWFSDLLDEQYPEVTDILFVARDGYLLKRIYEKLPHRLERKCHYVYAPRSVCKACEEASDYEQYAGYLRSLGLGNGTFALVDTVTMRFSAQKLISASTEQPVIGFYWVVLQEAMRAGKGLKFQTYQKKRYHIISAWNLVEFIMTSPEPPVQSLEHGKPVYYSENEFEPKRAVIFKEMSEGILEFVRDLACAGQRLPEISEDFIVSWLNDFLSNPNQEDLDAFEQVTFSMEADHSDSIPLAPFAGNNYFAPPKLKDRIWAVSQRYPGVYRVLHVMKSLYRKLVKKHNHVCITSERGDFKHVKKTER